MYFFNYAQSYSIFLFFYVSVNAQKNGTRLDGICQAAKLCVLMLGVCVRVCARVLWFCLHVCQSVQIALPNVGVWVWVCKHVPMFVWLFWQGCFELLQEKGGRRMEVFFFYSPHTVLASTSLLLSLWRVLWFLCNVINSAFVHVRNRETCLYVQAEARGLYMRERGDRQKGRQHPWRNSNSLCAMWPGWRWLH